MVMARRLFNTASMDGLKQGVRAGGQPIPRASSIICISIPSANTVMTLCSFVIQRCGYCVRGGGGGITFRATRKKVMKDDGND